MKHVIKQLHYQTCLRQVGKKIQQLTLPNCQTVLFLWSLRVPLRFATTTVPAEFLDPAMTVNTFRLSQPCPATGVMRWHRGAVVLRRLVAWPAFLLCVALASDGFVTWGRIEKVPHRCPRPASDASEQLDLSPGRTRYVPGRRLVSKSKRRKSKPYDPAAGAKSRRNIGWLLVIMGCHHLILHVFVDSCAYHVLSQF